jgi:hypothetical protein
VAILLVDQMDPEIILKLFKVGLRKGWIRFSFLKHGASVQNE